MDKQEVDIYKKEAIEIAKQLLYGKEVISKIRTAQTVGEIERIMVKARAEM